MLSQNGVDTNIHIPISVDQLILVQNSLGAINLNSCNYMVIFINIKLSTITDWLALMICGLIFDNSLEIRLENRTALNIQNDLK